MSFINVNANDAQEAKPVPAGRYNLTIGSCEHKLSKEKNNPGLSCRINIDGHADAPSILFWSGIPTTPEEVKSFYPGTTFKRFMSAFGQKIDPAGFDPEQLALQLIGATASGIEVLQEMYNDEPQNKINLPKVSEDGAASKGRGSPPKR